MSAFLRKGWNLLFASYPEAEPVADQQKKSVWKRVGVK